MKFNLYTKIIYICLLLLAILPVFNAFNLTWKELVRLFVITLGLLYLYVKYLRRGKPQSVAGPGNLEPTEPRTSHFALPTSHFEPLLLSIVYMFLITQFDPATSAIKDIIPQSRLNWFFIASSALIFVGFGAFLLQQFGVGRKGNLGSRSTPHALRTTYFALGFLDKFVLIAGSITIASLLITKRFVSHEFEATNTLYSVTKVIEFMMLYFVVVKIMGRNYMESAESFDRQRASYINIQRIFVVAMSVFVLVLVAGTHENMKAIISYAKGNKLIETGNVEQGAKLLGCIRSIDLYFDKSNYILYNILKENKGKFIDEDLRNQMICSFKHQKRTSEGEKLTKLKERLSVLYSKNREFDLAYEEIKYLNGSQIESVLAVLNDHETSYLLALFHFYGLRFKKAMLFLSKALIHNPKDLGLLFKSAKAQEYTNNRDLALSQIRKIRDIDPENTTALYYEGYYNYIKGNIDIAKEVFSKGIKSTKDEGEKEFYKGVLYYLEKKVDASIASYKRSEDLGFKKDYLFSNLGKLYSEKGMLYESVKAYTKAFRLSPWMLEVRKGLISSLSRYSQKYGLRGVDFGKNIIYNGGFEKGTERWHDYTPSGQTTKVVDDEVYSGRFATLLEGGKLGCYGGRYQGKTIGEDELYYHSCWVKAENIDHLKVCLLHWAIPGHAANFKSVAKGCDWKKYECFFIIPPQINNRSTQFYPILIYNVGKVWIDDIVLKRYQGYHIF